MKTNESPKRLTAEVKKELGPESGPLTDDQVAEWFHYKNRGSYATSPKKPWIENGLACFLEFLKSNFVLLTKDQAKTAAEALEDLAGRLDNSEEVTDDEKDLLNILKQ